MVAEARPGRLQVAAIQRARILAAAVAVLDELGYADSSVANVVERARVSRRTFYEIFTNREECLAAVLEDTLARVELEFEKADVVRLAWRERLRMGLWTVLSFLDREPRLARVCVVQTLAGGSVVLTRRQEILARLAGVVDQGRFESGRGAECSHLTAEGVVGAAFTIVHARLLQAKGEPLTSLLGELMGLIVLPYLGPAAARRERERPAPQASAPIPSESESEREPAADLLRGVPMRLTYRTARVLEGIQSHPGASNRQVADQAGIGDPGQVSRLLRRLERIGLLDNRGGGHVQGEPNAWQLTAEGERVARGIRTHGRYESEAA